MRRSVVRCDCATHPRATRRTSSGSLGKTQGALERARVVALAGVAFIFLGGLLRSRVAQSRAVSTLVTQLSTDGQQSSLRDVLAERAGRSATQPR
jgi:hypothetical protein